MNGLGKSGASWLSGPYRSPSTLASTLGRANAVFGAFRTGYWVGEKLDQRFNFSGTAADFYADRTPRSVKWWIHRNL